MKQTNDADGMVQALMDMALFCDRAVKACEDGNTSPLDVDVSWFETGKWFVLRSYDSHIQ